LTMKRHKKEKICLNKKITNNTKRLLLSVVTLYLSFLGIKCKRTKRVYAANRTQHLNGGTQ